jgi:hypothetical protein
MVLRFGERKEERKIFGDDEVEALCLPRLGVPKAHSLGSNLPRGYLEIKKGR